MRSYFQERLFQTYWLRLSPVLFPSKWQITPNGTWLIVTGRSFIHGVFGGVGRLPYSLFDFLSYGNHKKRQSEPCHWHWIGWGWALFSVCTSSKLSRRGCTVVRKASFAVLRHGKCATYSNTAICPPAQRHGDETDTDLTHVNNLFPVHTGEYLCIRAKVRKWPWWRNRPWKIHPWPWNVAYQPLQAVQNTINRQATSHSMVQAVAHSSNMEMEVNHMHSNSCWMSETRAARCTVHTSL